MAPMKHDSNYRSSNYGEDVVRQANVLASCYLVDGAASLKGLHYCTTGVTGLPSPPSSPPLAAITSTNQLALTPKAKSRSGTSRSRGDSNGSTRRRRGGAALRIREECERFFCETLRTAFLVERNAAPHGSGLTGVHYDYNHHDGVAGHDGQLTPPYEYPFPDKDRLAGGAGGSEAESAGFDVSAWLEIWDYVGGTSFRAFLCQNAEGEKSLFVFFDAPVIERDLKQALVALIELAEGPLDCSHMVICVDRSIPDSSEAKVEKGLQWAGFSYTTLDYWAEGLDVTSDRWLFMGMEI